MVKKKINGGAFPFFCSDFIEFILVCISFFLLVFGNELLFVLG